MRLPLVLVTLVALAGCESPYFPRVQPTPRWSASQQAPVITERWVDGFVPVESWKTDYLEVFGDGRWQVTRAYNPTMSRPSAIVASGSMAPGSLEGVLSKAFERPIMGPCFLDLAEHSNSEVADAPVRTLAVKIDNASHSVTVSGPTSDAFTRFETAVASQTVKLPVAL